MKRSAIFILSLLLTMLIAAGVAGCNGQEPDNSEKKFVLEVVDIDGSITEHEITTTEAFVGPALFEAGFTNSAEFVTVVLGVRADYVLDGYWWAFYADGEMSVVGAGGTAVKEGVIYAFIYTEAS
ncbi:MAG: DUF4430 domain-containing protein [Oscillospiraceae bacterium]|nr:DUF4430 domain-containing protein [Oscillospiraceae bacterium]